MKKKETKKTTKKTTKTKKKVEDIKLEEPVEEIVEIKEEESSNKKMWVCVHGFRPHPVASMEEALAFAKGRPFTIKVK